jgi:hypothetical protein
LIPSYVFGANVKTDFVGNGEAQRHHGGRLIGTVFGMIAAK